MWVRFPLGAPNLLYLGMAKSRLFKILLILLIVSVVGYLVYFFGFVFLAGHLVDHPVFSALNYKRLYDWDLPRHSLDQDLDGDGQTDFVSFTGCALLTKANPEQIPAERQCAAEGIFSLAKTINSEAIGQSYLKNPITNYSLDSYFKDTTFMYSYMFQDQKTWYIVTQQGFFGAPQTMKITTEGYLEPVATPLIHQVQVLLYRLSVILLVPIFYLVDLLFDR